MSNTDQFSFEADQPEGKDMKRVLLQYTRYWYLLVIGAALGLGGAFVFLRYYAVPQYRVYSTMLIKDDKNGQGMSNADALNDLSSLKTTRNIDNEIEVLKSKSLMQRVVKELDLFITYYTEGKFKNKEIYGETSPIKIIANKLDSTAAGKSFTIYLKTNTSFTLDDNSGAITSYNFGQQITKPYGVFTVLASSEKGNTGRKVIVNFQSIQQVANYYSNAVVILPVSKSTSVLTLSLVDPIPERAKNIVNKLMEMYNREAIEDKNLVAANTLKFLDNRLKYVTLELSGVEKGVEKYKSSNGLTDITTQANDFSAQASAYNKQLTDWGIQIDILGSIESYLTKTSGQFSTVPSTLGIPDATLSGLIKSFNELQLERERMLRTIQPGSEIILNINEQLANLRSNILENIRNIRGGLQITSNRLRANSGQFQSKVKQVPGMERELHDISRQQEIKHNIYVYLLQKREETALSLAATASIARVLDPAMGGDFPISPNGQAIYLMALLLGLSLPIAGIYGSSLLNNKVQSQQDVSSVTTTPIIGEIAHNSMNETVVVTKSNRSPIAEMFRLVRANLNFATVGKENIVLLVTSSMSGEGKTFFSINLSASLALTDKRVILLDLDLRDPKVATDLNLPKQLGITDYLVSSNLSISDIISFSEQAPSLSIITAGTLPPNPAELLMSPKFAQLIHELKASFDYIIFDTPPVGQVADAFTLNSFIDFSIYLVRYNYTYKAQLGIIKNIYKNKTLNQPMIIVNDAKEQNGSNYGYGYGYGYDQKETKSKKAAR